ncbi:MAG: ATP-binding protein [Bacteroidota bacterium]
MQIRIFDDSLEVWSPGTLPKEINVKTLLTENRSIPINKILAKIFYSIKLIENWGTGFQRIANACSENNNPPPEFNEKTGAFVITFYKKKQNEGVNEGVNLLREKIRNDPGKRTNELSKLINVPQKTIERWIKKLKKEKKIEFRGNPKTGGYYTIGKKS